MHLSDAGFWVEFEVATCGLPGDLLKLCDSIVFPGTGLLQFRSRLCIAVPVCLQVANGPLSSGAKKEAACGLQAPQESNPTCNGAVCDGEAAPQHTSTDSPRAIMIDAGTGPQHSSCQCDRDRPSAPAAPVLLRCLAASRQLEPFLSKVKLSLKFKARCCFLFTTGQAHSSLSHRLLIFISRFLTTHIIPLVALSTALSHRSLPLQTKGPGGR